MFRMGVMHTAIGRKNDPLPLAIPPPIKKPALQDQICKAASAESEIYLFFGMETIMIICYLSFVSYS